MFFQKLKNDSKLLKNNKLYIFIYLYKQRMTSSDDAVYNYWYDKNMLDLKKRELALLEAFAKTEHYGVRLGCVVNGVPTYSPKIDSYWTLYNDACARQHIVNKSFRTKELVLVDVVVVMGRDMPADEILKKDQDQLYLIEAKINGEAMMAFEFFVKAINKMHSVSVKQQIGLVKQKIASGDKLVKKQQPFVKKQRLQDQSVDSSENA